MMMHEQMQEEDTGREEEEEEEMNERETDVMMILMHLRFFSFPRFRLLLFMSALLFMNDVWYTLLSSFLYSRKTIYFFSTLFKFLLLCLHN